MRMITCITLVLGGFVGTCLAGTIQFQETNLGGNVFTYSYFISGFTFQQNEELDVRFDPALYGVLSNPTAGPDFSAMVFQPNNPPGTFGDYSALALVNNPSFTGPFKVTVTYLGSGQPGSQPFYLNLYDTNLDFIGTLASGTTTPGGPTTIPEPGSLALAGLGILSGGAWWAVRRRDRLAARQ
jgi:hypothetical protein